MEENFPLYKVKIFLLVYGVEVFALLYKNNLFYQTFCFLPQILLFYNYVQSDNSIIRLHIKNLSFLFKSLKIICFNFRVLHFIFFFTFLIISKSIFLFSFKKKFLRTLNLEKYTHFKFNNIIFFVIFKILHQPS